MVSDTTEDDTPGYLQHPGELCQDCRRNLPRSGRCTAIAVILEPCLTEQERKDGEQERRTWSVFCAAPYAVDVDPTNARRRKLGADLQADTDTALDYRRGAEDFCSAYRPRSTSPAKARPLDEVTR
jgi:hypothetical protein